MKFTMPSLRNLPPLVIAIIVLSCLLILPKSFVQSPGLGIDSSWSISINMIYKESLTFGKDFVFTYGPLGFLNTRYSDFIGTIPFILADCLTLSVLIYILLIVWEQTQDIFSFVIIPYLIMLASLNYEVTFLYFSLFLFLIFHFHFSKNLISAILAGLLAVLVFFIKLNSGLIIVVILQLFLTINIPWSKIPVWKSILTFLIPAASIIITSAILPVDLWGYMKGSIEIVNYYNDAMFNIDFIENAKRLTYFNFLLAIIVIAALAWFVLANFLTIFTNFNHIILTFTLLLVLYIGWKQAFTRYDPVRGTYFFFYGTLFIGTACLFLEDRRLKNSLNRVFALMLILSPLISTGLGSSFNHFTLPYQDLFLLSKESKIHQQQYFKESVKLDSLTRQTIGNQTTDIFPTDVVYAYYNDLTYSPRPAIQSYQAYSEYLTHLNYQKYTSDTAPEFILHTPTSLDQYRYSLWSDSHAWLGILQNYDFQSMTPDSVILLKKRNTIMNLDHKIYLDREIEMGKIYQLNPKKSLTYLKAHVSYSLWGKICRILVRPPVLYMKVWYSDNSSQIIKAIIPELKGGVLLKKASNLNEISQLYISKGSESPSVTRFQFLGASEDFKHSIKISLNEVNLN